MMKNVLITHKFVVVIDNVLFRTGVSKKYFYLELEKWIIPHIADLIELKPVEIARQTLNRTNSENHKTEREISSCSEFLFPKKSFSVLLIEDR